MWGLFNINFVSKQVKLPDGQMKSIHFSICVLACGADTGDIAKLARIGTGEGLLSIPLPIEKRLEWTLFYHLRFKYI